MEEIKNTGTEEVVETGASAAPEKEAIPTMPTEKMTEILAKRQASLMRSILKDNNITDAAADEYIENYNASIQSAKKQEAEALTALKTQNAELSKKLFDIELNGAAAKAAAEIGMDSAKLSYAMKLADTTKAVKDGKIDKDALKSALQGVLTDIPEFKSKTQEKVEPIVKKIGVQNTEPEAIDTMSRLRKRYGLADN